MTSIYLSQFLTVAAVHLLAVASPGPDFAVVVHQSVTHGRRTALLTSCGVGMGIMVHVLYCLLGFGLLVSSSPMLFAIMKVAGAVYLLYLGGKALRAGKISEQESGDVEATGLPSARRAVWTGFLTNGLNPKATLFFLALFTVVISPSTPRSVQLCYGIYMAFATALWFAMISLLFGHQRVRRFFGLAGHWFERVRGVALIAIAVEILLASAQ